VKPPNNDTMLTLSQKIDRSATWQELIGLFYSGGRFDIGRRNTDAPLNLYLDPVLCRLYDALHEEERANYLQGIISEIKQHVFMLPEGSTVVEIGCGPGRIVLGLASDPDISAKRYRFVGYDPSPEMIAIAEEKLRKMHPRGLLSFFVGSTNDPMAVAELSNASFVICRNILSWLPNAAAEFQRWSKLLPPQATVYIRDLRRDLPLELAKRRLLECAAFRFQNGRLTYPPQSMLTAYMRAFVPSELKALLSNAGLSCEERSVRSSLPADSGRTIDAEMLFIAKPTQGEKATLDAPSSRNSPSHAGITSS
jgi:SAM-dependent methyltransferase